VTLVGVKTVFSAIEFYIRGIFLFYHSINCEEVKIYEFYILFISHHGITNLFQKK